MALPLTRNTTYVATRTPSVKADDLNALQDSIVTAFNTAHFTVPVAGVDTPQEAFNDAAGNRRSSVDKNGFPAGNFNAYRQDWIMCPPTTGTAFGPLALADGTITGFSSGSGALNIPSVTAPSNTYPAQLVKIVPGASNTDQCAVYQPGFIFPADVTSLVLDFDWQANDTAHNTLYQMGFTDSIGGTPTSNQQALCFHYNEAVNWQLQTANGGASTITDTGVAVSISQVLQFRIEFHGKNTPIGVAPCYSLAANQAKALAFINGALAVAITGSSLPTAKFQTVFRGYCTGASSSSAFVGPFRLAWNRWLSSKA